MKKLFSLIMILCLFSTFAFAASDDDEYDDDYYYEMTGAGDQFLRVQLFGAFPLNFEKQLKVGGGAVAGYYKFIADDIALGGEVSITDNFTIGKKPLICIPITFNVLYQPSFGKFEFPISLGLGISAITLSSTNYFPGFSLKGSAGAFYRISETWSFGMEGTFYWLPEWHKDKQYNDNLLMAAAGLSARFHF